MADVRTVADTGPYFSSIGQDESTAETAAGVIQDIADAPEISSDRDFNDDAVNPLDGVLLIHIGTHERRVSFGCGGGPARGSSSSSRRGRAGGGASSWRCRCCICGVILLWSSTQCNWRFFFGILLLLPPPPPPPSPPPPAPPRQTASAHYRRRFPTHRYQPL